MILLIDAYNVVRFLHPGGRHATEPQIKWFLSQLGAYRKVKCADITEVIVVFDGGLFSRKVREIIGGVVVVHAGVGRKADDVLVQYAVELRERALLISNDRELQRRALISKTSSMDVSVFWQLLEAACAKHKKQNAPVVSEYGALVITKYTNSCMTDEEVPYAGDEDVDALMISGSLCGDVVALKKDDTVGSVKASRSGLSKKDKQLVALRKKLG